jgi:Cu2+-exporting ATPase
VAAALEAKSEHPLAKAVLDGATARGITAAAVTDFEAVAGSGLTARLGHAQLLGGNRRFAESRAFLPPEAVDFADRLADKGQTPLYFCRDDRLLGIIGVADTLKEDSAEAIRQLREMGLRVVMLTGDNARTARAIADEAGIDEVIADVLPQGKEAAMRQLQQSGSGLFTEAQQGLLLLSVVLRIFSRADRDVSVEPMEIPESWYKD